MATVQTTTKIYPFLSDWSLEPMPKSQQPHPSMNVDNKDVSMQEIRTEGLKSDQQKPASLWSYVAPGFAIGVLVGGIALATVLTYWLSLTSQITTITTSTTTSTSMDLVAFS
ncbi:unnamed protein product [Rotaria sp. Silwood2]|nr:unnamed protein product [Rotaria sp. Silwood2]CAF4125375.1 unnamed protein product [Rotaria sp. Silwood2]CAF4313519.1 unnamed protein product [Rotaria sp. Silwood2]